MYFEHKTTGQKIFKLALAINLDTMAEQVLFCPDNCENTIFSMSVDKFDSHYHAVVKQLEAA